MIPHISALRALVSLAQTGSITKTAQVMRLTQSAVSHQMKTLETLLGYPLLERDGRGVRLTHRARHYVAEIAPALDTLARASDMMELTGALTLNVAPGFAASWLAPRLGGFLASHPGLSITLNTPRGYGDLGRRDEDIYVSFLTRGQTPEHARHLMDVAFFPVASPQLTGGRTLQCASDVLAYPLLHLDGTQDWSAWAADAGLPRAGPLSGIIFQDMQIMAAAARAGQGVALGDQLTNKAALERGELVRLHGHDWPSPRAYWLIEGDTPPSEGKTAFTNWLSANLDA